MIKKKLHERIHVVYEDRDIIVVDKSHGILSYPVEGEREESAIQLIRRYWKAIRSKSEHLYLLHRLDRETSGLLVFAVSSLARASLLEQFADHSVVRSYIAVTQGIPANKEKRIETFLGRDVRGRRSVTSKGKAAVTLYRVLKENRLANRALIRCYLETGRTHQVRIHLAHVGAPVIGDPVYARSGTRSRNTPGRMALHAEALGFIHPRTGRPFLLRTSIPQQLKAMLERGAGAAGTTIGGA